MSPFSFLRECCDCGNEFVTYYYKRKISRCNDCENKRAEDKALKFELKKYPRFMPIKPNKIIPDLIKVVPNLSKKRKPRSYLIKLECYFCKEKWEVPIGCPRHTDSWAYNVGKKGEKKWFCGDFCIESWRRIYPADRRCFYPTLEHQQAANSLGANIKTVKQLNLMPIIELKVLQRKLNRALKPDVFRRKEFRGDLRVVKAIGSEKTVKLIELEIDKLTKKILLRRYKNV